MSLLNSGARVSEALIRSFQVHREDERLDAGAAHRLAFSIAVSREAGSRGSSIARHLGARLDWPVYDQELLETIARRLHVNAASLDSIDERHVSWIQETVERFCNVAPVSEGTYVSHLVATLVQLAAEGSGVFVGRGAAFVLPAATTLRVRLMAPLADRIANVRFEQLLNSSDAERQVLQIDRERLQFVRTHFLHDPTDPDHYDLVLNTSRFSDAECADVIIDALEAKQHREATVGTA